MDDRRRTGAPRTRRWIIVALACLWLGVMAAAAAWLSRSEADARRELAGRLQNRIAGGAEFASLYVQGIFARERAEASLLLAGPAPSYRDVRLASGALGSPASVLLDARGQVLQVLPAKPSLIGQVITSKYAHLSAAVAGRTAVSNVVPSAARGVPVVAFAAPFPGPTGRRVFSVAFAVAATPLGAYMNHLLVLPGNRVYLTDATGTLIAGSGNTLARSATLAGDDPRLAVLAPTRTTGTYTAGGASRVFVTAPVSGTPWRIVASEPAAELYSSIDGSGFAWFALAALALAGLLILAIGARLARSRDQLAHLAAERDRLARVDSLTGLRNRRDLEETLNQAISLAQRHGQPIAALMIDIDHFKQINDTLGHHAGDAVLISTARSLHDALRAEDTIGRWGGEEFLAVLPGTDSEAAYTVAERLRSAVRQSASDPDDQPVTVTIGIAMSRGSSARELIRDADAALYAGKRAGRDTVRTAQEQPGPDTCAIMGADVAATDDRLARARA